MGTGLFSTRAVTPQGIGARAHQRLRRRANLAATLDAFAERLSLHGDVPKAAREIGKSAAYGWQLFAKIREGLGWQAC